MTMQEKDAYWKAYHEANREARNARARAYYQKNKKEILRGARARELERAASGLPARPSRVAEDRLARIKELNRKHALRSKYGITPEEYDAMFAAQGGRCAICRETKEKRLVTDHCHDTGRVRGLLCSTCNTGIGHLKHDPSVLGAAILYLSGVNNGPVS